MLTMKHRQFRLSFIFSSHFFSPLQIASLWSKLTQMSECEKFRKLLYNELDYFSQFVNSYKGANASSPEENIQFLAEHPKFGWLWLTFGAHDYEKESMTIDTELYDFFIRNKDELDESFVFVLGDHGLRFGEV